MKKRWLSGLTLVLLACVFGITLLLTTAGGSHWLLQKIFAAVPGGVTATDIQGQLTDRIQITGLDYKNESGQYHIDQLDFQWQPSRLFTRQLIIDHLLVKGIRIKLAESKQPDAAKTDLSKGLPLPIQPTVNNLLLTDIDFEKGDVKQHLSKIQLIAKTENNRITLSTLTIDADIGSVVANGYISTVQNFPLNLTLTWQAKLGEHGYWQGASQFSGDMLKLTTGQQISSPLKLALTGSLGNLLTSLRLDLQGEWQNLQWPPTASPPQIISRQGQFSIDGPITAYQLRLATDLSPPQFEQAFVNLKAAGSTSQIKIDQLDIKSKNGLFQLNGTASWLTTPTFDITATGQAFNPAFLVPELPGRLSLNSRIQGNIAPGGNQIQADIDYLKGTLREQPFNAGGHIQLAGEQLKIDTFKLTSGINNLYVNGTIEKNKGNLDIDIDMPKLTHLWPTLTGSLKGSGRVDGGWQKPVVNLTLNGKQLQFDQHAVKMLDVNVAYSPDERKSSVVNLTANTLTSGGLTIDRLTLDGKGALSQHQVNLTLTSPKVNLAAALNGSWQAPRWQAKLTEFKLTDLQDKTWSLNTALPIQVEKKLEGIQANVEEGCLAHQAAALCFKLNYAANADLNAGLTARALPSELIQPFLPESLKIASQLNGKVNLQRKNQVLAGGYQFETTPVAITLAAKDGIKSLNLQPLTLAGTMQHENITANLRVNLADQDYLHAQLIFNTGVAQTLSGNISAQVNNLSSLQVFAPQLNKLSGNLSANLKLGGYLKQPKVEGFVNLNNGVVESDKMGLHQFNLQSRINTVNGNRILISGSTIPVIINPPQVQDTVNLKSALNFKADIRQSPSLNGEFEISVPSTTISLVKNGNTKDITLGNSLIKGNILRDTVSADLNIALMKQDAIRGNLRLGLSETKPLSAQVNASISDFSMVQAFVPDLGQIQGLLTLALTAKGTATKPEISGNLAINNGSVGLDSLGIVISQIAFHAGSPVLASNVIQVHGSAKSGKGNLTLDGSIKLMPEFHWLGELKLIGQDFVVVKLPEAEINIAPDLIISTTNDQTKITGKIDVPKAVIKIQEIPENAVKVSADEIILGETLPETEPTQAPNLLADIRVILGKNCNFSGQGLKTDLNGNLRIIKTAANLSMQGSINLSKATYKSYGQDLTVRKGQFVFTGPVENPWINVEAIRVSKDQKITAILTLNGPLNNPQTEISSEPSLPQSEALAYLVTGSSLSQAGQSQSNMLASAALAYGADKAGWLASTFGVTDFNVQEGNNLKDTLLVMGRYITPDFYIGAKVGMFNKQAILVLKRKLYKNFNVETQAGTSQRIKLNYEIDAD